jgi:GNAT superfamily N-acetyltransferase
MILVAAAGRSVISAMSTPEEEWMRADVKYTMVKSDKPSRPADIGIIRQYQPEDADPASNLARACLMLDPLMPPAVKEVLIRAESPAIMRERANLFYVAVCVVEGRIAGVAGVDMNEIRLLLVDPEHQHKGIGGLLLHHLESMVPSGLFRDIFVYSTPSAVGFYRVHGYQAGGEHTFHVGGCNIPTTFMTKRLAS